MSPKPRRTPGSGTISKRADGRWEGRITVGYTERGNPRRRAVYAKTKREVEAKLTELRAMYGSGRLPPPDKLTIAQLFARWLEAKSRQVRPKTMESYRYTWERHIEPSLGSRRLSRLTGLHIETMLQDLLAAGVSVRSVRYARTVLGMACKQAVRWGLLLRSPVEGVDAPRREPRELEVWTGDQVMAFLAAAHGERLLALFYLALTTGLRMGELLGLEWRDLDGDMLTVRRSLGVIKGKGLVVTEPKTRRGTRSLRLPDDTLAVLEAHRELQEHERKLAEKLGRWQPCGAIFASVRGGRLHPRNVRRALERVIARAGVPRITFHDLRHTHATLLLESGVVSLTELSARLGHHDPAFTLSVYTHAKPDRERVAIGLKEIGGESVN